MYAGKNMECESSTKGRPRFFQNPPISIDGITYISENLIPREINT